ncbi:MAG: 3-isopropylmalate dehydratase small subunit [Dehalococcoidia bacterium]|nr:3-isopropylmalate dehydratase small subunit [Dehalococcoidia bacterium]
MRQVTTVTGNAIPLNRADVDTDQIIPKQFLKRIERSGFGEFAFFDWRKDPDFITNDPRYKGAPIMLAQQNFGCGSSREHAVWAIEDMGVTAIIAPSFGDIFRVNCSKVGLVTVELPHEDVNYLISRMEELPQTQIVVDVASQTVSVTGTDWKRQFAIDPFVKHRLLNGLDDIGLTLQHIDVIAEFEATRSTLKPATTAAFADTVKTP